jgi:hypothetical protein
MADHRELAVPGFTTVNVAIAAPHRSGSRSEVSASDIDERLAKGRTSGLIADQWGKNVTFLQKDTASHADRFLALTDVNSTGDPTTAIHAGELLLKSTRQEHPAKRLEVLFVDWRFGWSFFLLGSRRLQHRTIVTNIGSGAQKIFRSAILSFPPQ